MNRAFVTAAVLAIILSVLAAVGTPSADPSAAETLYVLDVSRSHGPAPDLLLERLRQWHERTGSRGPYRVIQAGTNAVEGTGEVPAGFAEGSRVDLGLELARVVRGRARRVIVLSDGRFDHEPVVREVAALAADGVTVAFAGPLAEPALDLRLLPRGAARVENSRARVRAGITGTNREPRTIFLTVGGGSEKSGATITIPPGATEEWEALVPVGAGASSLTVRIALDGIPDAVPSNDELVVPLVRDRLTALVVGEHDGLRLSAEHRPVIVEALGAIGFDVQQAGTLDEVTPARLAGVDLLVVIDQPVTNVPHDRLREIEAAVIGGGLGLWVIGGERSFGAGGYAASRFDDLLPLSSRTTTHHGITVILDTSGSMERDDRLGRAFDAIVALAEELSPEDRIQVLPFADHPGGPVPREPAASDDFLGLSVPELRRMVARGGTRLLPALEAALALPRSPDLQSVFVIITDLKDDAFSDHDAFLKGRALKEQNVRSMVVLLDVVGLDDERLERARRISTTGTVITAPDYSPRIRAHVLETEPFDQTAADTTLRDGTQGPRIAWRNRVREGKDALVELFTKDRAPVMASAFRGVGRTAAWAGWPVAESAVPKLAGEWALKTARPGGWKKLAARREGTRVVLSMPPEMVPSGPLSVRSGTGGATAVLDERAPGVFEVPSEAALGPHLTVLAGSSVLGVVPVPPMGDSEYAFPPGLPAAGDPAPSGSEARLRAPWAVVAAAAWAAALLLRARRAGAG